MSCELVSAKCLGNKDRELSKVMTLGIAMFDPFIKVSWEREMFEIGINDTLESQV